MRVFALIVGLLALAFGGSCILLTGGGANALLLGWAPLAIGSALLLAFFRNPRERPFPQWAKVVAVLAFAALALLAGFLILLMVSLGR